MARDNVLPMISTLIYAVKANIRLYFKQATATNLADREIFKTVQISINLTILDPPSIAVTDVQPITKQGLLYVLIYRGVEGKIVDLL
ncbi:MAG: flotillin-like FloA family protein [Candidatus Amoebophilus sp.]